MKKLDTTRWAAAVPPGMRALPRWCGWRGTKQPLNPKTGEPARVDDPSTFGSFSDALKFYQQHEEQADAGCGFVFTKGDSLLFIDIDHCLTSNSIIKPWASPLVTAVENTYVETSPSGTGLHVFAIGELPRAEGVSGARVPVEDGAVEVYAERRFSTVTGWRFNKAPLGIVVPATATHLPAALWDKLKRTETATPQVREPLSRRREVWEAMQAIDPDCSNDEWVTVGMALKAAFGDAGLPLWRSWSKRGKKYKEGEPEARWASFRRSGVGLGSIFHKARATLRWHPPATDAEEDAFDEPRRTWWTVPLTEVEDERLQWLVRDLGLVKGYASLLAGDPGRGKSLVTLDVAARLTAGRPMPWEPADTHREPCRVLYLNAEDGAGDTIKPRARAAGADLSRFEVMDITHGSRVPQLPNDVEELESMLCERPDVQLVVIDPLNAFLARDVDAHKAHDVRQALQPLGDALKRTSRVVWLIAHLNKNEAMSALYRVSGSSDYTAFVRTAMLLGKDPEDEDEARRVLAPLKWNLGPPPTARGLSVVDAGSGDAGKVEWGEESDVGVEDAVRRQPRDSGGGAVGEAEAWLRSLLAAGPLPSRDVEARARDAGISRATLNRAAKRMDLRREKTEDGWQWPQVHSEFKEEP